MAEPDDGYAHLLARNARLQGEDAALVGDFAPVTHAALHARCRRVAAGLSARGVGPGDRVAVLAHNRPELLVLLGAVAARGAMLVLLNARASAAETAALIAQAAPRLVVVERALAAAVVDACGDLPVHAFDDAHAEGLRPWSELEASEPIDDAGIDAAAPWVGLPTAAVDGQARIALLSQRALLHQAHSLAQAWQLGPQDRHLCVLPLFHLAGLGLALAGQVVGAASVLMSRHDPVAAVAAVRRWRASYFASFAPILGSLLDAAQDLPGEPLASLRSVTGLESPETAARLARTCTGAVFWRSYGQTETGGIVSLAPCAGDAAGAGRPLPGTTLRIERDDGSTACAGETGEIVVRGPGVFDGYWQQPDHSAHVARGGWHHTGDRGAIDESGRLTYAGRAPDKLLIKSGGENVYPAEVEHALLAHPAIAAAVVFGVPDARWGEAVRAVCERHAGQPVEAPALVAFVEGRLARFKRPRDVVFVDRLPRRSDGSVDRAAAAAQHGG